MKQAEASKAIEGWEHFPCKLVGVMIAGKVSQTTIIESEITSKEQLEEAALRGAKMCDKLEPQMLT